MNRQAGDCACFKRERAETSCKSAFQGVGHHRPPATNEAVSPPIKPPFRDAQKSHWLTFLGLSCFHAPADSVELLAQLSCWAAGVALKLVESWTVESWTAEYRPAMAVLLVGMAPELSQSFWQLRNALRELVFYMSRWCRRPSPCCSLSSAFSRSSSPPLPPKHDPTLVSAILSILCSQISTLRSCWPS
jgi:hypothetical protein